MPILGVVRVKGMTQKFDRPYVISWNLTNRCNLKCEHCYLDAGAAKDRKLNSDGFENRDELGTEECKQIMDQIAEFAPETVTILTGGEPLLRRDILELINYGAKKDLWVVCGSNGVTITENLAHLLKENGLKGMALSLDSLEEAIHDKFRGVAGAWQNTVKGAQALTKVGLPFIVQTSVHKYNYHQLEAIADFAFNTLKAKVFNLYFLVSTGRGQFVSDISPQQYAEVLKTLIQIQEKYSGKMLVNAKCAPHYQRVLYEENQESPFLKTFAQGAGGCPAGTQYMGIRPNGDMTPCPYLPKFGGNLTNKKMEDIWDNSDIFREIRNRSELKNRCGACEFTDVCGGCRARAYGNTGDFMEEDELCDYEVGVYAKEDIRSKFNITYTDKAASIPGGSDLGGGESLGFKAEAKKIKWKDEARENMKKIPVFVRGMVISRVESYCEKNGISTVTAEVLADIRSKMPTKRFFKT